MAAKKETANETVIQYGNAAVRIFERTNGMFAVSWREGGKITKTTKATREKAVTFAQAKARALDGSTGLRLVSPAAAERLKWLERIAGGEGNVSNLLFAVEKAVAGLGSFNHLEAAAAYYRTHGPAAIQELSLTDAVETFLAEYKDSPAPSRYEMTNELRPLAKMQPGLALLDVTRQLLETHIHTRTKGKGSLSKRTIANRIERWNRFFNRCRTLGYWPEGRKNPTASLRRPTLDDTAPEIFTPDQGRQLLEWVIAEKRQFLPYLLIAGWLHCRPSECLRLLWTDFDFEHRQLHLRAQVVGKTSRERWIPIPAPLCKLLLILKETDPPHHLKKPRVCRCKSREEISRLARSKGLPWPDDVLRHSSITYRLQVLKNIDDTAEESGNSPAIIRKNYRRPIPPGQGKKWADLLNGIKL